MRFGAFGTPLAGRASWTRAREKIKGGGRTMGQPHFIVFANEKGGTGKSTTAVHTADRAGRIGPPGRRARPRQRQRTMTRYLENRDATMRRLDKQLPQAPMKCSRTRARQASTPPSPACREDADVIVIDTPGRDDPIARAAILKADTLVTPMNDSFVDLDLIGQVHPENFKVTKPELLCRADLEQPHPARQGHRQERRLGRAAQPPPAHRSAQSHAASAPRSTNLPAASASGSSRASASASSTASCSPRA